MTEREILDRLKHTIHDAPIDVLDSIKARPVDKMSEHDDITRQSAAPSMMKRFIPFTVAAAAFIGIFFQWQSQYVWADSQVYFDVNPSIVATLNRQEQVIALDGINPDAQDIVRGLDFKGKSIIEVTQDLLDQLLEKNYLTETEQYILLSVYNRRDQVAIDQRSKIDQAIHKHMADRQIRPVVVHQNITDPDDDQLSQLDASEGRATLIRKLIELAPNIQRDVLSQMSVHELVNIARAFNVDLHQLFDSQDFDEIEEEEIPDFEIPDDDHDDDHDDDDIIDDHNQDDYIEDEHNEDVHNDADDSDDDKEDDHTNADDEDDHNENEDDDHNDADDDDDDTDGDNNDADDDDDHNDEEDDDHNDE